MNAARVGGRTEADLGVDVTLDEGASVSASATVTIGRRTHGFAGAHIPFVSFKVAALPHSLSLKAPLALRRVLRRAVRRDRRVVAKVRVVAVDRSRNRRIVTRNVRLAG